MNLSTSQLTSFLDKDLVRNILYWAKVLNKRFHSFLSLTHFIFMNEDRII